MSYAFHFDGRTRQQRLNVARDHAKSRAEILQEAAKRRQEREAQETLLQAALKIQKFVRQHRARMALERLSVEALQDHVTTPGNASEAGLRVAAQMKSKPQREETAPSTQTSVRESRERDIARVRRLCFSFATVSRCVVEDQRHPWKSKLLHLTTALEGAGESGEEPPNRYPKEERLPFLHWIAPHRERQALLCKSVARVWEALQPLFLVGSAAVLPCAFCQKTRQENGNAGSGSCVCTTRFSEVVEAIGGEWVLRDVLRGSLEALRYDIMERQDEKEEERVDPTLSTCSKAEAASVCFQLLDAVLRCLYTVLHSPGFQQQEMAPPKEAKEDPSLAAVLRVGAVTESLCVLLLQYSQELGRRRPLSLVSLPWWTPFFIPSVSHVMSRRHIAFKPLSNTTTHREEEGSTNAVTSRHMVGLQWLMEALWPRIRESFLLFGVVLRDRVTKNSSEGEGSVTQELPHPSIYKSVVLVHRSHNRAQTKGRRLHQCPEQYAWEHVCWDCLTHVEAQLLLSTTLASMHQPIPTTMEPQTVMMRRVAEVARFQSCFRDPERSATSSHQLLILQAVLVESVVEIVDHQIHVEGAMQHFKEQQQQQEKQQAKQENAFPVITAFGIAPPVSHGHFLDSPFGSPSAAGLHGNSTPRELTSRVTPRLRLLQTLCQDELPEEVLDGKKISLLQQKSEGVLSELSVLLPFFIKWTSPTSEWETQCSSGAAAMTMTVTRRAGLLRRWLECVGQLMLELCQVSTFAPQLVDALNQLSQASSTTISEMAGSSAGTLPANDRGVVATARLQHRHLLYDLMGAWFITSGGFQLLECIASNEFMEANEPSKHLGPPVSEQGFSEPHTTAPASGTNQAKRHKLEVEEKNRDASDSDHHRGMLDYMCRVFAWPLFYLHRSHREEVSSILSSPVLLKQLWGLYRQRSPALLRMEHHPETLRMLVEGMVQNPVEETEAKARNSTTHSSASSPLSWFSSGLEARLPHSLRGWGNAAETAEEGRSSGASDDDSEHSFRAVEVSLRQSAAMDGLDRGGGSGGGRGYGNAMRTPEQIRLAEESTARKQAKLKTIPLMSLPSPPPYWAEQFALPFGASMRSLFWDPHPDLSVLFFLLMYQYVEGTNLAEDVRFEVVFTLKEYNVLVLYFRDIVLRSHTYGVVPHPEMEAVAELAVELLVKLHMVDATLDNSKGLVNPMAWVMPWKEKQHLGKRGLPSTTLQMLVDGQYSDEAGGGDDDDDEEEARRRQQQVLDLSQRVPLSQRSKSHPRERNVLSLSVKTPSKFQRSFSWSLTERVCRLLRRAPFLFAFTDRVSLFSVYLRQRAESRAISFFDPPVEIRRASLFEDAFRQFHLKRARNIHLIRFIDAYGNPEPGIGHGVYLEFICQLCKQAFDVQYGLFCATADGSLYPNPCSAEATGDKLHLEKFRFLGAMLGRSISDGILQKIDLCCHFVNSLLGHRNTFSELKNFDEQLYIQLIRLTQLSAADIEALALNFTTTQEKLGAMEEVELVRGGRHLPVTKDNCVHYVSLVADYKLNRQAAAQTNAFQNGLHQCIEPSLLHLFDGPELMIFLCGHRGNAIDVENWKRFTTYSNSDGDRDITIQIFWKVVESFNAEQRSELLRFSTSMYSPPLLGFEYLTPQFHIQLLSDKSQDSLPSASTCFSTLKLPPYMTFETARSKILTAMQGTNGFDFS